MDYKTRQLMRDLVQNPYMGIIVVDRECRIKFINQTYLDILGRSENEVLNRPVTEITPHSRLPEVIQKGQPILADLWQVNGQEMVVARLPIMEDGQVIGAVGKSLFLDLAGARPLLEKLRHLEKELTYYRNELGSIYQARWRLDDLVGQSERMQRLKNLTVQVARTTSTILITGESGTGKELLAHAIHNASPRQNRPFVRVNCAAIPENLLESELFGYEEGAFTGAVKGGKPGKFELAHGGSIFLDEIGDMPVYMQTKLLRVLQEREVERLGGNRPLPVNVRVIAATNRHLEEMLKARQFRADLYYRLNVVTLHIPALRRRPEDIPLLVEKLLDRLGRRLGTPLRGVTPEAMQLLQSYHWPGNVRELENMLERAANLAVLGQGDRLAPEHFPALLPAAGTPPTLPRAVQELELSLIRQALQKTSGNKVQAARLLGIHCSALYRKLARYGLHQPG